MKQLQAVIERLPSDVEYAFVQAIFAALPPVREAAVWVTAAPTDEILSVFNYGTYGAVDRLLRQHEKALVRLPENGPNTARTLLDAVRHSLAQLLMAEASAKAKAPGDCRLEELRQQQAAGMAFLDVFWLCAVVSAVLLVLVLLMKRSVAERGEHIGAE